MKKIAVPFPRASAPPESFPLQPYTPPARAAGGMHPTIHYEEGRYRDVLNLLLPL